MSANVLDDDYVAKLLAEDAKKTSRNYATRGLEASARQDGLKPNTRFLSHIVREADGHNAALKRKEEHEARRRLRALQRQDEPPTKKRRTDETDSSKRRRLLNDIVGAASDHRSSRHNSGEERRPPKNRPHSSRSDKKSSHRKRSASPCGEREQRERSSSRDRRNRHSKCQQSVHDDRPTPRGRGAARARRPIDYLAEDYDPSRDVSERSDLTEDDDWDLALEAMRNRAKYKNSQSSRMREAGFSDKDIAKFEQSLTKDRREGDMSQIKWSKKGQVREWDVNKVVDIG